MLPVLFICVCILSCEYTHINSYCLSYILLRLIEWQMSLLPVSWRNAGIFEKLAIFGNRRFIHLFQSIHFSLNILTLALVFEIDTLGYMHYLSAIFISTCWVYEIFMRGLIMLNIGINFVLFSNIVIKLVTKWLIVIGHWLFWIFMTSLSSFKHE